MMSRLAAPHALDGIRTETSNRRRGRRQGSTKGMLGNNSSEIAISPTGFPSAMQGKVTALPSRSRDDHASDETYPIFFRTL